jgi:hypothetical protein
MLAHKMLHEAYERLGDTINHKKYQAIGNGLLRSIIASGDGETCETGWHVVQIEEEYFILKAVGAEILQQSLINSGFSCDKMETNSKKGKMIYYFEISKVLEGENILLKEK